MNCIVIRFYGDLNYFLHPNQRQLAFSHFFNEQPSVKDIIESLGVPHTEVDLLLIDGKSADFSQKLHGGERVAVYPVFKSLDISAVTQVRPETLSEFRFILDVHLGKLASYLRMLGFDTLYSNAASGDQLADCSSSDRRILLTFDRELLKRKKVVYGYCVRSRDPNLQLVEVLNRFELFDRLHPFVRCMLCNGILKPVPKEDVLSLLPENVRLYFDEFHQCQSCGHVYWKGSHYEHMMDFVRQLKKKI
ncbi:MAG TPA: Mut7-C RNAse domain-containing protein [Clostridia bacterium]|nr:Mut7-C RNAse domain-containing protein [Clostridia bacterium]